MQWLANWLVVNGCLVKTDEALIQVCRVFIDQGQQLTIELVPKDPVSGGHILSINDPWEQ